MLVPFVRLVVLVVGVIMRLVLVLVLRERLLVQAGLLGLVLLVLPVLVTVLLCRLGVSLYCLTLLE